ncbi:Proteinase-activated receptor 1 [Oryzias melastigma]|uniref:Proteinase-activated receptor 1 n=1 Tax=Oryzias melastigma TaxID=30732 RepID=A0A834F928_ORYME|nr:Proteinase-activated receptor 1 [Oryzias melastigma]
MVKDKPVEDIDLDIMGGSGGSGMETEQEAGKWHSQRRQPPEQYFVSEEAKGFLQGRLATTFVPTVYTLVFIISVPLNLVAMVMFVRYIRPKKAAVIYMLNLACADLLFGLFLPFRIAYHYHGNDWIYGSFMCRLVTASFHCNMYCSVLLVTCISIDRFLAVVYPMDSLKWRSPQTACGCVCRHVAPVPGWCLPPPHVNTDRTVVRSGDHHLSRCAGSRKAARLWQRPTVENRSKKSRAMVMAGTVLLVFVVCFTPTNIILMVHYVQLAHKSSDGSYQAYLLSVCLGSFSCCLDPLLYYFGSSQCQKQVMTLLGCTRPAESSLETHNTRADGSSKTEGVQTSQGSHYSRLEA